MCSLGELRLLIAELGIAPLPPEQRGVASTRIAAAAQSLGYASEEPPARGRTSATKRKTA